MNKRDNNYCLCWAKRIRVIQHLGGKCVKCGNDNALQIDMHHVDQDDKEAILNTLKWCRWEKIEKELKKCSLLCRNCHCETHLGKYNLLKSKLLDIKGEKKCSVCGYDKCTACLDFHHTGEKKKDFDISRGYAEGRWRIPLEKIITEMSKCIVLCRNCHVIEQMDTERFDMFRQEIYKRVDNPQTKQPMISREEILRLHNVGKNGKEMAEILGCARSTICEALKKLNATR